MCFLNFCVSSEHLHLCFKHRELLFQHFHQKVQTVLDRRRDDTRVMKHQRKTDHKVLGIVYGRHLHSYQQYFKWLWLEGEKQVDREVVAQRILTLCSVSYHTKTFLTHFLVHIHTILIQLAPLIVV